MSRRQGSPAPPRAFEDLSLTPDRPAFATAFKFWLKLGLISFGGPAGQIAIMQHELVERRRWIGQRQFLHALNFCMLLPGPEAQQLATYVGWRLHGVRGAMAAGTLFVLPGALVLLLLAWLAAAHQDAAPVAAVFYGFKPVVIAIIAAAVWRLGRRVLRGGASVALAVAAFVGLYVLKIPFPWIIAAAALAGFAATLAGRDLFAIPAHNPQGGDGTSRAQEREGERARGPAGGVARPRRGGFARLAKLVALFLVLWAVPVGAVVALFGSEPFIGIATLFTKAAFVTFGGAYAVLPYIAQAGVEQYHWLTPAEMINGLALAETTPGPLILVTQYVGFFAGWNNPEALAPITAGILAAALTTYVTFLPCFLFILAGAPYIEHLQDNRTAASALAAITSAVVGVILSLGVFLAEAALLPAGRGIDWFAIVLAAAAFVVLIRWNLAIHWLVLLGAAAGGLTILVPGLVP